MRMTWFTLCLTTFVVSVVYGGLALRQARTTNRLGRTVWLTLFFEPEAFSEAAATYRRVSVYSLLLFVVLVFIGLVLFAFAIPT